VSAAAASWREAVRPTARAVVWPPMVGVAGGLVVLAFLYRDLEAASRTLLGMGAGALAATVVFSLRDPAAVLLAAVPVPRLARRLLRLAVVGVVAAPAWLLITLVLPSSGTGTGPASLLALISAGLAAATWLPSDDDIAVAAAVPLLWVTLSEILALGSGALATAALWNTHPWWVVAGCAALTVLGRHR